MSLISAASLELRSLAIRARQSPRVQRLRALGRCLLPLRPGATIITVNWNSLEQVQTLIRAWRRHRSSDTELIVVDNGSTDGSVEWLSDQPDVRLIRLDRNKGHGPALDLGAYACRSEFLITIDVDAFPIRADWVERLTALIEGGGVVAGARGGALTHAALVEMPPAWADVDHFVHPCCLCMRLRRFVFRGHTFRKIQTPERLADPAESISWKERGRLRFLDLTSLRGPGNLGEVHGGIVYHNGYSTRHRREGTTLVDGIPLDEVEQAWREAVEKYDLGEP